ncbi:MAG: NYN domain-containing protein [Lentinula lateritia]|nr:MAG: NYN domain-containing protein [Lentinula lateritia]
MKEAEIAIFWDYENCPVPSGVSGHEIVNRIRTLAHEFGSIKVLKAYTQLSDQAIHSSRSAILRSELQSSGVSITDCPHNNYKNVADQMIIVDMLAFAMDNSSGSLSTPTIMLISGDRDFAYALSVLRLRRYNVVVVGPSTVHSSLRAQASSFFEWNGNVLDGPGRDVDSSYLRSSHSRIRSRSSNDVVMTMTNSPLSRTTTLVSPASGGGSCFLSNLRASHTLKEESGFEQVPPPALASTYRPSRMGLAEPFSETSSYSVRPYSTTRLQATSKSPPGCSAFTEQLLELEEPLYHNDERTTRAVKNISNVAAASCSKNTPPSLTPTNERHSKTEVIAPTPSRNRSLPRAPLPPTPRPRSADSYLPKKLKPTHVTLRTTKFSTTTIAKSPKARTKPLQTGTINISDENTSAITVESSSTLPKHVLSGGVMLSSFSTLPPSVVGVPSDKTAPPGPGILSSWTRSPAASDAFSASPPSPMRAPLPPLSPSPFSTQAPFIPRNFLFLVQHLEKLRLKGTPAPSRSDVSFALMKKDKQTYQRAGCTKFKDYTSKAEQLGLVKLGGREGEAWIQLHPDLQGRIEVNE